VLPKRYHARFCARPELVPFSSFIQWEQDESVVLQRATSVIFALPPSLQQERVILSLQHAHIDRLLLEKPLAPCPESAARLFDHLLHSGKIFRIGYLFRYTHWGKQLLAALRVNDRNDLFIRWNFLAHHFHHPISTWKRSHAAGGGVIRFYGIHLVALLAEAGYREVVLSDTTGLLADESEEWRAVFKGEGLPRCEVRINSRSSTKRFQIISKTIQADLPEPFSADQYENQPTSLDQRIPVLIQLCQSLWQSTTYEYHWYAATIELWRTIEEKNISQKGKETLIEKEIN
jgi:hypothetical protein